MAIAFMELVSHNKQIEKNKLKNKICDVLLKKKEKRDMEILSEKKRKKLSCSKVGYF